MFQRLLICTNLADGLQRLVHFVPSLAAANIQHITFLSCVPLNEAGAIPRVDTEKVEQAHQQLDQVERSHLEGITVEVKIESGRPTDLIFKVAKEQKADLLMVGYSFRNALSERLFGNTSIDLYNRTTVPMLSVRPQLISTYTTEELDLRCRHLFRHLMLPYDGTEASKYLIEQVKQRVQQNPTCSLKSCNIVWVFDDSERRDIPREPFIQEARKQLASVKAELEALQLEVSANVLIGSPTLKVIEGSLEPDVSAIAVCRNPRNTFLQRSIPSFTQEMLRHSWHPILYFPFVQ